METTEPDFYLNIELSSNRPTVSRGGCFHRFEAMEELANTTTSPVFQSHSPQLNGRRGKALSDGKPRRIEILAFQRVRRTRPTTDPYVVCTRRMPTYEGLKVPWACDLEEHYRGLLTEDSTDLSVELREKVGTTGTLSTTLGLAGSKTSEI